MLYWYCHFSTATFSSVFSSSTLLTVKKIYFKTVLNLFKVKTKIGQIGFKVTGIYIKLTLKKGTFLSVTGLLLGPQMPPQIFLENIALTPADFSPILLWALDQSILGAI